MPNEIDRELVSAEKGLGFLMGRDVKSGITKQF